MNSAECPENPPDTRPTIETERLVLRPFQPSDAPAQHVLINDKEIAANTRSIEFPYPEGAALKWIEQHPKMWLDGKAAVFAICLKPDGQLVGAIGLEISPQDENAELGYWLGRKFWNQGIATEAAAAVVRFGFQTLALNKIHAHHVTRNPASGRILEKIGMTREGLFRRHIKKWGTFEDVAFYGILKSDMSD
jgi:RimJ/RimL family protein N-acetyltransferase